MRPRPFLPWFLAGYLALFALLAPAAPPETPAPVATQVQGADLYLFWRRGCPHCEKELAYLESLRAATRELRVHAFELDVEPSHRTLFARVVEMLRIADPAVPLTIIGARHLVGYDDDSTTGAAIAALVHECIAQGCPDIVAPLAEGREPPAAVTTPRPMMPERLRVPLLGEIDTRAVSLPAMTLLLGSLDGFNPCAMWVLMLLIGLLAGLRDRARMWVLGGAFIVASAGIYYLFMAAWLSLLLFVGATVWVRSLIAVVALAGGGYYLREFFLNSEVACKVTAPERRRRVFERLKALATERRFWLALTGIVALAFAVNLVELFCSAGIPAVYTQLLAMNDLPAWQYHAYLGLYILAFMFDDLVVFICTMLAIEAVGLGSRYLRWSRLIGGLLLLAIGVLLLLRPQWLAFGREASKDPVTATRHGASRFSLASACTPFPVGAQYLPNWSASSSQLERKFFPI